MGEMFTGESPRTFAMQSAGNGFPLFPKRPELDDVGSSSESAEANVLSCLRLVLTLADELSRYNIENIRTVKFRYFDTPGALQSLETVALFCKELDAALRNSLVSPPDSPDSPHISSKGKEPITSGTVGAEAGIDDVVGRRSAGPELSVVSSVPFPRPEYLSAHEQVNAPSSSSLSLVEPPLSSEMELSQEGVYRCYTEVVADPSDDMAINIKLMDRVRVDIRMEDGVTGIGTNLNTGAMGSFPLSCLEVPSDVDTRDWKRSGTLASSVLSGNTSVSSELAGGALRGYADAHMPPHVVTQNFVLSPVPEDRPRVRRESEPLVSRFNSEDNQVMNGVSESSRPPQRSDSLQQRLEALYQYQHVPSEAVSEPLPQPTQHQIPMRVASVQPRPQQASGPPVPAKDHPSAEPSTAPAMIHVPGPSRPGLTRAATKPLSAQVIEKRKFARQVIAELYETEKNFMEGMEVLINQFMYPLAHASSSEETTITKVEHSTLFRNIPGLRNLSRKICELLKAAMAKAEADEEGDVGGGAVAAVVNVFLVNVEFEEWSTYVRYMEGYSHAKQTFAQLKERPEFSEVLDKLESAKECNRYTFEHYMILPVQRIGRYHLLLGRLKKVTDEEDPVHQSIETAEQYMKQIGDVLESVQKQEEELRRVFEVYEAIEGCPPDIISASRRRLLSSFEVDELFSGRKLHMHVFSDCFLLSTRNRSTSSASLQHTVSSAASLANTWKNRNKDKDKDRSRKENQKEFTFVARVELRDVEVQSVGNVEDGLAGFPELSPYLQLSGGNSGRVAVLRHIPGGGTFERHSKIVGLPLISATDHERIPVPPSHRRSIDSSSSSLSSPSSPSNLSRHPSTSSGGSTFGHMNLSRRGTAKSMNGIIGRPSMDQDSQRGDQDLYAFRVPDSTRMAGLLAALGLAGVQRP
ncbi:uncharacterized protein SPPG_02606 [Spizellomyces punctatus DAOM BR117]|uniref:DH domain-containing protein n=1 Tax=Spizellomyces punctatus (strain DAOM BR117) TaxID=645134 RepID=A0A0L0HMU0_SPIPD|nr:uncharacterized protein SPPG_02606 [Spizellomyces punctatus DAOM BR117]KND02109.1 hypothetical protein SPPG_02606 [Spizellomyces punctatus DAOM BR117]|eukprot:XP_016610148.1 hypothetical protein SPPG_02606 [Spizellomyces punctatus DAOM BR117]